MSQPAAPPWKQQAERLFAERRYGEAAAAYRQALAQAPDDATTTSLLAESLFRSGQAGEADRFSRMSLALAPDSPAMLCNFANIQLELGRHQLARDCLNRAIALQPDSPIPHFSLAKAMLRQGDWAPAWAEWEWNRRMRPGWESAGLPKRLWRGERLKGETVLVWADQGMGDTLQFARFAPVVQRAGGRVVLAVESSLASLMKGYAGLEVFSIGGALPRCDLHIPLMSLLGVFQITPQRIIPQPEVIAPPAGSAALWGAVIPSDGMCNIGLVWAGNASRPNDQFRSIPLGRFAPLLGLPGTRFYSLQVGGRAGDLQTTGLGHQIADLSPLLTDYGQTAGAIAQLDLVISVDTSVCHLAGAMGRKVWTLLSRYGLDWRWLEQGEATAWYPSMRLIRQDHTAQWEPVIARLAEELRQINRN